MQKVLYLHGLKSQLHSDRREVMQSFDLEIYAPILDYEGNPNVLNELINTYEVDLCIGSSAGGLGAYYFSGIKNIPALLFNPALPFRNYMREIPNLPIREKFLQVVIGARDIQVPAFKSFDFLTREFDQNVPMEIHWFNQMQHGIPIDVFEQEVRFFIHKIRKEL